jgi:AcrR family transcriptional regulator
VVLAMGGKPTVADFATAAGVSRASFYRAFRSREALLEALNRAPEPDARERILDAALEMVGAGGLAALSMDDLADRAQVSRATLYRLFAGKSALFAAVVETYSPIEPVTEVLSSMQGEPPDRVMPEVALAACRTIYGGGANRTGLLRALFFEVSSLAPDTEVAMRAGMLKVVGAMLMYVTAQMSEGRLRQMHPLLAIQSFVGPIFFHLMTRPAVDRVLGLDVDAEQAVTELAHAWLRAMAPQGGN